MGFQIDDFVQFKDDGAICRGHIAYIGESHITIDIIAWRTPTDANWRHGFYKRYLTTKQAAVLVENVRDWNAD